MEDVVAILMRHSEEGETPERRAGNQMKGLLLKVSAGVMLGVSWWVWAEGVKECVLQTLPHLFLREGSSSHPVNPFPSC